MGFGDDLFGTTEERAAKPSVEERIEEKRRFAAERNETLARIGFSEVHEIRGGGGFDVLSMFGGGPQEFVCCQRCGAMVLLGRALDVEMDGETRQIEKGVHDHINFHERLGDTTPLAGLPCPGEHRAVDPDDGMQELHDSGLACQYSAEREMWVLRDA